MSQLSPEWIALHSPGCTALWELVPDAAPRWAYWGPRLSDDALAAVKSAPTPQPTTWTSQGDHPLSILPGVGMGWHGQSALLAHRAGADWTVAITGCRVETLSADALRFHLTDAVSQLAIEVDVRLDPGTDTLSMATRLTNAGDAVLDVQWLAAGTLPLPANAAQVLSYTGRHNAEFTPITDALTRSLWRRENRRGISSHACFPGALVSCADGTAYGAQLAWSGNHAQSIEWLEDGGYHWHMGEWLAPGEVRLAPGETLSSPEWLATCSADGADGVAHNFHRAIRARTPWPGGGMKPRPVHLNTWEALYFFHDEASLMQLADAAAALGVERFVLDDGWFHDRNNDRSSLGDWWADARKYPGGLGPLARHVVSAGMEFGLWIEPEMVSPDSDLYRAHPDWALSVAGRPLLTARNQLVLDLTRPEVADHVFGLITATLDDLPVSYLKWDHNRDLLHAGAAPLYRTQVHAAYALMDRFRTRYPAIEIEACAGGGGRIDAGIAAHCHRFWASDNLDPVARLAMQHGFLQFLPPELMGSHVGASPAHSSGRASAMALRCAAAMQGAFGLELDIRKIDDSDRSQLRLAIASYKALRGLIHTGRLWRGGTPDGYRWLAYGSAAQLALFAWTEVPTANARIHLPMLEANTTYRITDCLVETGASDTALYPADDGLELIIAAGPSVRVLHLKQP